MVWLLEAGEDVTEGKVLTWQGYESVQVGFFDSGDRHFKAALFCCEDSVPPKRQINSVHQLCEVNYSISCTKLWMESSYRNPLTREKWRDCIFDIGVLLNKANMDFVVAYKGEIVAAVEAEYMEDF
jgi:hypothetical protein